MNFELRFLTSDDHTMPPTVLHLLVFEKPFDFDTFQIEGDSRNTYAPIVDLTILYFGADSCSMLSS